MTNGRNRHIRRGAAKKLSENEKRLNAAAFTVLEFGEIKAGAATGPHRSARKEESSHVIDPG